MRLALVVVVHDLQPEVGVALDEGRPDVRDVVAPAATKLAVHVVLALVVLEPVELVEPVGPEAAPLARRGARRSSARSGAACGRFRGGRLTGRDGRRWFHRRPEDLLQEGLFGGASSGSGRRSRRRRRRIGTGRLATGLTLEAVPVGELARTCRGRVGDDRNCTLGQLKLLLVLLVLALAGSRRLELFGQARKKRLLLALEQVLGVRVERLLLYGSWGGRGQGQRGRPTSGGGRRRLLVLVLWLLLGGFARGRLTSPNIFREVWR